MLMCSTGVLWWFDAALDSVWAGWGAAGRAHRHAYRDIAAQNSKTEGSAGELAFADVWMGFKQ